MLWLDEASCHQHHAAAEDDIDTQARDLYQADVLRIQHGEPAHLGYLFIVRQYYDDVVVVYPSRDSAESALDDDEDLLINGLCEEDCLDAYVPDTITASDLQAKDIILAPREGTT